MHAHGVFFTCKRRHTASREQEASKSNENIEEELLHDSSRTPDICPRDISRGFIKYTERKIPKRILFSVVEVCVCSLLPQQSSYFRTYNVL